MSRWMSRVRSLSPPAVRALAVGALLHAQAVPGFARMCAYVANENDATVSVIDAASNLSTATIQVGGSPSAVAVTPGGTFAYVSNLGPDAVSVIGASSGMVTKHIDLPECTAPLCGPEAVAIAANDHSVYVPGPVDDGSHLLSVIDTITNMVTDTITIQADAAPRGGGVAVTTDGLLACVSGYELKAVTGQPQPDAVLYSHVLDIATKTLVPRTTDLGQIESMQDFLDSARTAAAVTPDGVCYVTDGFTGKVLVIAMAGNTLVTTILLNTTLTGIAITPDGKSAFVSAGTSAMPPASLDEGQIFVIDTTANTVTGTIRLRGHFLTSVAVSPNGAFAMTTDRDSNRVFVIDTASNKLTASISVGSGATGVAIASVAGDCPGAPCVGDCNLDGAVTVDELVTVAGIALQSAPVSDCKPGDANKDGRITIDEILRAVEKATNGCPPPRT